MRAPPPRPPWSLCSSAVITSVAKTACECCSPLELLFAHLCFTNIKGANVYFLQNCHKLSLTPIRCRCEMNALLDIHCAASPAQRKHAVVFVLSEALEPTDSWVVSDAACNAQ